MDYKMIYLAKRNPSVAAEDWPKHWRSHPKFVSQFPMVGAAIDNLNYCARMLEPSLGGEPASAPGASRDYDGVAVVASRDERLHDMEMPKDIYDQVMDDERRVFSTNVEKFAMQGREMLIRGDKRGPAAVIRFVARKPGLSREAFHEAWKAEDTSAVDKAIAGGQATRYVRNAVTAEPPPGYEYDGIEETWFPTAEAAVRAVEEGSLPAPASGVPAVTMLTHVIYALPRA
jgi:hypothetical protein